MFWSWFQDLMRLTGSKGNDLTREFNEYFWRYMPFHQYVVEWNKYMDYRHREPGEWKRYDISGN